MNIIVISPKGQITIPKKYRDRFKTKHCSLEIKGTTILLKPIKMSVVEEDLTNFGELSEKAFEFWNNQADNIYEEFYKTHE